MRERARMYGGMVHAEPRPGGGFEVAATLPLAPVAAGATQAPANRADQVLPTTSAAL
jgi:hypothetical protein